jgi:hypothetical protein
LAAVGVKYLEKAYSSRWRRFRLECSKGVVRIGTRREFAVSQQPLMISGRHSHAAVYHTPHLYVLGALSDRASVRESCLQRIDGKLCLLSLEIAVVRVE